MTKYIAFENGNKILITTLENYQNYVLDLNKCLTFDGTLEQAKQYVEQYLNK